MNRHAQYVWQHALAAVHSKGVRWFAVFGLTALTFASTAVPQAYAATAAAAGSPSVTACAITGTVTVTIAGIGAPVPIGCLNQATQSSPGTTDQAVANISVPGTAGIGNLGNIESPDSLAQYTSTADGVTLSGSTKAASVQLVQSLISAQNIGERLTCALNGQCQSSTTIGSFTVGGQAQTLPTPIPVNYSLPVQLNITLNLAGVGAITVPLSGVVVLNELKTTGTGSTTEVQHAAIHVTLGGGLNVNLPLVGLQLINVSIDLVDYVKIYPHTI